MHFNSGSVCAIFCDTSTANADLTLILVGGFQSRKQSEIVHFFASEQIPWIYAVFFLHFRQAAGLSTGQCKHFLSVHYRDLVFSSGYLWSEGWLQYRAPGIRKAYSVEVKVALPRNKLVYLSGPCQLNICLRDFLQFMKRGILKNLGEGHPCLTLAQQ